MFTDPLSVFAIRPQCAAAETPLHGRARGLSSIVRSLSRKEAHMAPYMSAAFQHAALMPVVRVYPLSVASALAPPEDGDGFRESDHSLTLLMTPDPLDRSHDRLFVDEVEIAPENWGWESDRRTVWWSQRDGACQLSGHVGFTMGFWALHGIASFGDEEHAVRSAVAEARFRCRVARVEGLAGLDVSKVDWSAVEATPENLRFSYWVEESGKERRPGVRCEDLQTGASWELRPKFSPFEPDEHVLSIDQSDLLIFEHTGENTPATDRRALPDERSRAVATVFPRKAKLQLDDLALSLRGGMEVTLPGGARAFYAVSGKADNPAIVGRYTLDGGREIAVHNRRVFIDGMPVPGAEVQGDKLVWHETLGAAECGLPASGAITFSADGETIVEGPFGAGRRAAPAAALAAAETKLDLSLLLNLDPYAETKAGMVDIVQEQARASMEKIIKANMKDRWRERFVQPGPIVLDPAIKAIAETKVDGQDPAAFYGSLTTLHLAAGLGATPGSPSAARINVPRVLAKARKKMSESKVYERHMGLLYQHHWQAKFPIITRFVADEQLGLEEKAKEIDDYVAKAAAHAAKYKGEDAKANQRLDAWLAEQRAAAEHAKTHRLYWPWKLFQSASSLNLMATVEVQIESGDANRASRRVQRFHALLQMLDKSSYYAERFGEVMRLFNLMQILTMRGDAAANVATLEKRIKAIIQKWLEGLGADASEELKELALGMKQYADRRASEISEATGVALKLILDVLRGGKELVGGVVSTVREVLELRRLLAEAFQEAFTGKIIEGYGTGRLDKIKNVFGGLTRFVQAAFGAAMSLVLAASFSLTVGLGWSSLSGEKKAFVIMLGAAQLGQFLVYVVKGGFELKAACWIMSTNGGFWSHMTKGSAITAQQIEVYYQSGIAKWIVRSGDTTGKAVELGNRMAAKVAKGGKAAEGAARAVGRFLGRGLLSVATVMLAAFGAVISIVNAIYDLANSKGAREYVMNSFFLAASIMELVAVVFQVAAMATVGALSAAFAVITWAVGALALIFTVVALVLLIIKLVEASKNPIDEFVAEEADPAKLLRDASGAAIDDFSFDIESKEGKILRGVTVRGAEGYLKLDKASAGVTTDVGRADTVFGFEIDEEGRVQISSTRVSGSDLSAIVLAWDGKQLAAVESGELRADHVLPRGEIAGDVERNTAGVVQKAKARLFFEIGGKRLYLAIRGGAATLEEQPFDLLLARSASKPEGLSMEVSLAVGDKDRVFAPDLALTGANQDGSETLEWHIEGALPDFLQFDRATGRVSQKPGHAPSAAGRSPELVLSAQNQQGGTRAIFQVEVVDLRAAA